MGLFGKKAAAALALGVCLTAAWVLGEPVPAAAGVGGPVAPPGGRVVWAHMMGQMPLDSGMQYGATYPIALHDPRLPQDKAHMGAQFADNLRHWGIGGIAFEIVPVKGSGAPGIPQYANLVKSLAGTGILVAPCIDTVKTPDDIITAIEDAYGVAASNGNPAIMPDGRLIVFSYGSKNLSPDQWGAIRDKVAADGFKVYLAGDASQANLAPARAIGNATTLAAHWDAAFNFPGVGMANAADSNASFGRAMAPLRKMWIGSIMPSYYRGINVNPASGPFGVDALATARMRSLWQDILQSGAPWAYWITLNDFVEHTNLAPDSAWGYTRSDMNLWFASAFTGSRYPYGRAMYLTTPQALHAGEAAVAELAVANPASSPITVHLEVVGSNGKALGGKDVTVAPGRLEAAQIPLTGPSGGALPFARAVASGPLGTITSAPILFSPQPKASRDHGVVNYYSVNSRLMPPAEWRPVVQAQADSVTVTGIAPDMLISADLLADGNLVDQIKFPSAAITLAKQRTMRFGRDTDDNKNSVLYPGPARYVVRLVLKNGALWFSDPLTNRPA